MSILTDISENLQRGKAKIVKELVQQAIDQGIPVQQILDEGLLDGMSVIGEKLSMPRMPASRIHAISRRRTGVRSIRPRGPCGASFQWPLELYQR